MDLRQIREALAAQVKEKVHRDVTVYAYDPGPGRQPPCIVIDAGEPFAEYHDSDFGSLIIPVNLELVAYVAADPISQGIALDDFCSDNGPSSIRAAVEAQRSTTAGTLGGMADDIVCDRAHRPREVDNKTMSVTFDVRVLARREKI